MDNQTRPARISVTERARVSMSALDCELFSGEIELMISAPKSQQFWVFAGTGRPGGVGDGGDSRNGAVEEDSDEGGAADEDGQAADERVVAPDPAFHPLLLPRPQRPADAAPAHFLHKMEKGSIAESITPSKATGPSKGHESTHHDRRRLRR